MKVQQIKPLLFTFPSPPKMLISKTCEMFAEAIPAGILQMYAFAKSSNRSYAAAGSIMISAFTTGFGSALLSYGERVDSEYDGVPL